MMSQQPVLAVVGATGVGKSDVAVRVAQAIDADIVNADSMQVYRGMDIGTAKLTEVERGGIEHHLIDVWDVAEEANVARYQELARAAIAQVHSRNRIPIVVGGSGLYVNAVLDDLKFPGHDPQVRARLEQDLLELGAPVLHERLSRLDPQAAAGILPTNGRRLVRALEVWEITGAAPRTRMPEPTSVYPVTLLGLRMPTDQLDIRLHQRVEHMWRRGFVAEVESLGGQLRNSPTAQYALGYRQILTYLDGQCSEDEAFNATVRATKKFSRRQTSWFGRDTRISWFDANGSLQDVFEHVESAVQFTT